MTILNCRCFLCKFNDKGKCRLETITLQDIESIIIGKVICVEAEPREGNCNESDLQICGAKPIDLGTAWGMPEEDMSEQEPKSRNEREFTC